MGGRRDLLHVIDDPAKQLEAFLTVCGALNAPRQLIETLVESRVDDPQG